MHALQNVTFSFDDRVLLDGITLHIPDGEVTALIGRNGSGKTTVLRIAAGELDPDAGAVSGGERVSYLPQYLAASGSVSEWLGKWPDSQVQRALVSVGLDGLPLDAEIATLSGGQKTKVGLAKAILEEPAVLLLDEPTNNLDLEGLAWLESFVRGFRGAVLLTSHDRAFLDAVATRTIELKDGKLAVYGGNYGFARDRQRQEREALAAKYVAQESYKKGLQEDISTTKNQALSVELTNKDSTTRRYAKKVARKATVRQARIEREMAGTDWLEKPFDEDAVYLPLPETFVPASKIVVDAEGISKDFSGRQVVSDVSFQLLGGERMQVVGPNGSGKSTLLGMVLGTVAPDGGRLRIGTGIRVGALSQNVSGLNLGNTGKAELLATAEHPTRCIHYARALGLTVEELGRPIGDLSRGQQAKLALAKALLGNPQLLVLDEPTNHIELEAREAIEAALKEFRGSILVASHDRYFIEALGVGKDVAL